MKRIVTAVCFTAMAIVLPIAGHAQDGSGLASQIGSLQSVLENLYNQMLPMCGKLIGVGRGIAGFAATWYIASRVWKHIANAEPIDFYPLFRPFVMGFCVMIFPSVIAMINGVMQPTVTGTAIMVQNSDKAIAALLKQKEEAVKNSPVWEMYVGANGEGDKEKWYKYTHNNADISSQGILESIGTDMRFAFDKYSYAFRNSVKQWMSEVLQVLFQAAALCINTLRTFQLIVLAILGPLVFGIATFDGFQHTLTAWIARYINIFLWLPVANIFGAIIGEIQVQMIQLDIGQVQASGDTFFSAADTGYLVFMLIGIVGYFTVPSVANSIVHAGGVGSMLNKVTNFTSITAGNVTKGASNTITSIGNAGSDLLTPYGSLGRSTGSDSKKTGRHDRYMQEKLSGKP